MSRYFNIFIVVLSLLFFSHCGSGSNLNSQQMGQVPSSWAKFLTVGEVTATLTVYDADGQIAMEQDLLVDLDAGTVSSPNKFQLSIGKTYRFVVVFGYALSSTNSIPYAYADFTWLMDEFSEDVTFSASDIRYSTDIADSSISLDISSGVLPDLDLDKDGWSNWEELRDRVSPTNANSVPVPPTVQITAHQNNNSNVASITVVAQDNAHIEDLQMVDPICGISVISDTLVTNVDGSVTRTLQVNLDLLSVSGTSRSLQALASDGVTPGQNANGKLEGFQVSGTSQPYFAFTEPAENGEVEGPTVFKGIACSREPIDPANIHFQNADISQVNWSSTNNLSGTYLEVNSDVVDTTVLPDGPVTLSVQVKDANDNQGQGSRTFAVVNDNEIKVVQPVGRRWVFGNEPISFSVKNVSDTNVVVVEGSPLFSLTSSTAGGAVGSLDVSTSAEGLVIPLTVRAIRSDGSELVRQVEFIVRNQPQIQLSSKADEVFEGWSTHLVYKVINVDPAQISVDEESAQPYQSCSPDPVMTGIQVCQGEFPIKVEDTETFELSAGRSPTNSEVCISCVSGQGIQITDLGELFPDLPEINVAYGTGDDDPLAQVQTPSDPSNDHYQLSLENQRSQTVDFDETKPGNDTFTLDGLKPRTDYMATLKIRDGGMNGNVVGEMFKEVTTGDLGLVGWWRFKDKTNPGKDSSGRNNHGATTGAEAIGSSEADWALEFDNFGDRMEVFDLNSILPDKGTALLWFVPYFDPYNVNNGGSNDSIVSLLNIASWGVDSLRVLYSQSGGYCFPAVPHSICIAQHGAPAPGEPISFAGVELPDNYQTWIFVAATWEKTAAAMEVTIYSSSGGAYSTPINDDFSPAFDLGELNLGFSGSTFDTWPTWAFWFTGKMQDVSVYNEALSPQAIKDICNRLRPGECN